MPKVWERESSIVCGSYSQDGFVSLLAGLPLELEWTSLRDATWDSMATEQIKKTKNKKQTQSIKKNRLYF